MDNNYLEHHGILGMRWGVRRYQNKDGSLTPAGEKRRAKLESNVAYLGGKEAVKKSKTDVTASTRAKKVEEKPKSDQQSDKPKYTGANDRFNGPNGELLAEKERLELERDIRKLKEENTPQKGSKYSEAFISAFGNQATSEGGKMVADFATGQAKRFLENMFGISDKKDSDYSKRKDDRYKAETERLKALTSYKMAVAKEKESQSKTDDKSKKDKKDKK